MRWRPVADRPGRLAPLHATRRGPRERGTPSGLGDGCASRPGRRGHRGPPAPEAEHHGFQQPEGDEPEEDRAEERERQEQVAGEVMSALANHNRFAIGVGRDRLHHLEVAAQLAGYRSDPDEQHHEECERRQPCKPAHSVTALSPEVVHRRCLAPCAPLRSSASSTSSGIKRLNHLIESSLRTWTTSPSFIETIIGGNCESNAETGWSSDGSL